jgi:hypothetical protein
MDIERDLAPPPSEKDAPPAAADLLPTAEPDSDLAPAYAAWRLDQAEETR